jgi:hypothetical protein
MRRIFLGIMAVSCVLIFAPFAPAQIASPQSDNLIENLCAPDFSEEFSDAFVPFALDLDFEQMEKVRVELLERGFNPGFDPERDTASDAQLMEAVEQFQAEHNLPVTGQVDGPTLAGLGIPPETSPKTSEPLPQRAKPSK